MTKPSVVARESQHTPVRDLGNGAIEYQLAHNARRVMNIGDAEFAEFIVRACNAHTSLVEALQATREFLSQFVEEMEELHGVGTDSTEELLEFFDDNQSNPHAEYYRLVGMGRKAIEQAEQALRLAQGEK